jgi:hypothetical protein
VFRAVASSNLGRAKNYFSDKMHQRRKINDQSQGIKAKRPYADRVWRFSLILRTINVKSATWIFECRSKPLKQKIQIWFSGQWKFHFFACSPQGFTATRYSKINVSGHFLSVQTFLNFFFWSNFGGTTKIWSFVKKSDALVGRV